MQAVVGAHDRARSPLLDGDLELQEVGFPEGRGADFGAEHLAAGLLVVQRIVLGGGDDVVRLDAADRGGVELTAQQRILAQIFEVAAVARIAGKVGAAGEEHVEALLPGLLADYGAAFEGEIRAEGGGQGQA